MGQTWYRGLQFQILQPPVLDASIPTLQRLYAIPRSNWRSPLPPLVRSRVGYTGHGVCQKRRFCLWKRKPRLRRLGTEHDRRHEGLRGGSGLGCPFPYVFERHLDAQATNHRDNVFAFAGFPGERGGGPKLIVSYHLSI
ncbi:hypothetical protein F5B21DRAFT_487583 [Xylaria acuta]|nr:hypothetical protein F5B21DRAFT_487583 [Xylaria acuta]